MILYATCERCEAIQEVATPAEQAAWRCQPCAVPRPRAKRASRAKPKRIVLCGYCQKEFPQYHSRQRFCSADCRVASGPHRDSHRQFTTEERSRGALQAAKNKREKMPPELTPEELAIYRRGYTRGYVLGHNALRRERKQAAA